MAENRTQTQPETQRSENRAVTRRGEYYPSRDLFANPFSMFRRLSEEMDRAFNSTFGLSREFAGERESLWSPPIEVRERDHNVEIHAELPGMTKDDVKVEVTEDGIILEGEKRRERETEEGGVHRSERSYGRFYRMIPLPDGADAEKAKAEFKNGVLKVQVPITEQKRKSKQIQINT
jgi:HSP20 family protein